MSVVAMRSTEMTSKSLSEAVSPCQACLHLEPNSLPKVSSPAIVYQHNGTASPRRFRMVAKLYESNFGHYILLTQDKLYAGSPVYLNLKHTTVQRVGNENTLRFVSNDCDGLCLTLGLSSEETLHKWLDAVTPHSSKSLSIPRSPLMPPLTEDDEE